MSLMNTPLVVLIVMDGWGVAPAGPGNPILQANLPNLRALWAAYPHTTLLASGEAVGLPRGEIGNTETGHLNLGAGRIVYQNLQSIDTSIANGNFFKNKTTRFIAVVIAVFAVITFLVGSPIESFNKYATLRPGTKSIT